MRQDRFTMLVPQHVIANTGVYILGCGAVGSVIGVLLAKLGVKKFILQDYDYVERPNIGVQIYDDSHLSMRKVDALNELLYAHGGDNIEVGRVHYRLTQRSGFRVPFHAVVKSANRPYVYIAAVDNLPTRKHFFRRVSQFTRPPYTGLFVDPRIGPTMFEIHAGGVGADKRRLRGWVRRDYERSFAGNPQPAPCGAETLPTTVFACAAKAVDSVILPWLTDKDFYSWQFVDCETSAVHTKTLLDGSYKRLRKDLSNRRKSA